MIRMLKIYQFTAVCPTLVALSNCTWELPQEMSLKLLRRSAPNVLDAYMPAYIDGTEL